MREKTRNSTIEALRIISMLMIVGLHYFNRKIGGVLNTSSHTNQILAHGLESVCISSVNVFVLISGYYLLPRKTTGLAKAIELYLLMVFYHLLALAIAVLLGEQAFSWRILFYAVFPFAEGEKWFLETYILLLLFLPFLNLLLERLSKAAHLLLIGIQLTIFSIWPSFFPSAPILDEGYGLTNFITLYFIAAYFRRYVTYKNPKLWRLCGVFGFIVSTVFIALTSFSYYSGRAWDYCYIFTISAAVSLFVLFLNLPETHSKVVNSVAGATFDVYLTHTVIYLQGLIYHKLMHTELYMDSSYMVVHFALCVVLQFMVCTGIGLLRQLIWKPTVGKLLHNSRLLAAEKHWEEQVFSNSEQD